MASGEGRGTQVDGFYGMDGKAQGASQGPATHGTKEFLRWILCDDPLLGRTSLFKESRLPFPHFHLGFKG